MTSIYRTLLLLLLQPPLDSCWAVWDRAEETFGVLHVTSVVEAKGGGKVVVFRVSLRGPSNSGWLVNEIDQALEHFGVIEDGLGG